MSSPDRPRRAAWRRRSYEVIFEADTPAGRAFDLALIVAILASVAVVMLDSVASVHARHGELLRTLEWFFTGLFTLEYALRLLSAPRPAQYARSFFGSIDLLAVLPTYVSLVIPGAEYFTVVRTLRVLRVFRVLKLAQHVSEMHTLGRALRASRRKITVFLLTVFTLVVMLGSLMYLIEGRGNGFTSIPTSVYWAIVTLTTVGYGDISPQTPLGQVLASVVMILGYSILAVPTGIVTVELARESRRSIPVTLRGCHGCGAEQHDEDARYCKRCGNLL